MKQFKINKTYNPSIKSYAFKLMSIIEARQNTDNLNIMHRKIKLKDLKKYKIDAGCNIKIKYSRNMPTRYNYLLSLRYWNANVCFFRAYARHTTPISYYRKRDVNDQ